jgi:hypothetical protein
MCDPSSGIIAEIFLQHIEKAHMTHQTHKYNNRKLFLLCVRHSPDLWPKPNYTITQSP